MVEINTFMQLLASIFSLLLVTFVFQALQIAFKTYSSFKKFKKLSNGLPIIDGFSPIGGHIGIVLHKRVWKILEDLSVKYGDTFGLMYNDRPIAATTDLDLIKRMIIDHDECDRIDPLGLPIDEVESDTIMFARGEQWNRIRKNTSPAFNAAKIRKSNVQAEISSVVENFVESIDFRLRKVEEKGEKFVVIDAEDLLHRFTLAMAFSCFYKQDNQVDFYAKKDRWQSVTDGVLRSFSSGLVKITIVFPMIRAFASKLAKFCPQGKMVSEIMGFIKQMTRMNLEASKKLDYATKKDSTLLISDGSRFRRNMIDYIIDQFHLGKLTKREYYHTTFFLFLAVDKSTTDSLAKLIYLLSINLDKQEKLRESLLLYGHESEYLGWCLNEAMRLYPPILIGCTRTLNRELITKEGYVLPVGTTVVTPAYSIHRSKANYGNDANEFKPERWAKAKGFHPMQFMPFGAGKRVCPGREFAMYNMRLLMNHLICKFKFNYQSGGNDEMLFESPFLIFTVFDGPTNIRVSRV